MRRLIRSGTVSAALLAHAAHGDVTFVLDNRTFTGFQFVPVVDYAGSAPVVGVLTGATINVTLNASTAYTYADDLYVYVDVEPMSIGGKLQIGGFSNLSAAQRYSWPNGAWNAPGTTSIGTVNLTTALAFTGDKAVDGTVWIGNGYGAAGTSGTWTGTITLHGVDACFLSGPCACGSAGTGDPDGDGRPSCIDNCPNTPNPGQADCDSDGQGDACESSPDCNLNGRPDNCDVGPGGTSADADSNGIPDECQPDCNSNGSLDTLDILNGTSSDCEGNGIPDECETKPVSHATGDLGRLGPNPSNGLFHDAVFAAGEVVLRVEVVADLGAPTEFARLTIGAGDAAVEVASTLFQNDGVDCPATPQSAEVRVPASVWNAVVASSAGAVPVSLRGSPLVDAAQCPQGRCAVFAAYRAARADCDGDGVADSCAIAAGAADCNGNLVPDACDLVAGAADIDGNSVPDACQPDCDGDTAPDAWEILTGLAADCDQDAVPDGCEITANPVLDCDSDGRLDACEVAEGAEGDCDDDGVLDRCEIAGGAVDCNGNGRPDSCDIAAGGGSGDVDGNQVPDDCQPDCNANGLPDAWEVTQGQVPDCDSNGRPDGCDIAAGAGDCDADGTLDRCEVADGATDKDGDGRPDACEYARGDFDLNGRVDGADLGYLLAIWGLPGQTIGDLNSDGTISGADLGMLLSRWGPCAY